MTTREHSLTIVSWNIDSGGVDDGCTDRFYAQLAFLHGRGADVVLVQEAQGWDEGGYALLHAAQNTLGMVGVLAAAPHTRCPLVTLWRPETVQAVRHSTDTVHHWHSRLILTCRFLADRGGPRGWKITNLHWSPFDPDARLREAYLLTEMATPQRATVLGGDFNCLAPGDPEPDWAAVEPAHRVRHVRLDHPQVADRRAAEVLAAAGFVDVGGRHGRREPTAGFSHQHGGLRVDRFLASPTLADAVERYERLDDPAVHDLSDHRPILMRLHVDPPTPQPAGPNR